jgi:hypothetical protein
MDPLLYDGAMPGTPNARSLAAAIVIAGLLISAGGCGGDDDSADTAAPAPPASAFPATEGRTLQQLASGMSAEEQIVVSPNTQVFVEGENRFGFGVFTVDHAEVEGAQVALYAAPAGGGKALGPFPARIESLSVEGPYESRTTAEDPDAAHQVYVSDVDLPREGQWDVVAVIKDGDELSATLVPTITVARNAAIPAPGEPAPDIHTPTEQDVRDLAEIDTRDPHDSMHDIDFADVVGERPAVLLFATPALCQSRVCGPVVDEAEEVKADFGEEAAFIHMEVFEDNDLNKGPRPQFKAFGLPTEPWLFVIDDRGRVSTRIEGAFSVAELEDAVRRVVE